MQTTKQTTAARIGEDELVHDWRFKQLAAAGYPPSAVAKLIDRRDIDLHVAIALLRRDCDPETALRILP